jgi:beta-N-acetylhexosaminidase
MARLPGKLTFWRRRALALLCIGGIAALAWIVFADGSDGAGGASELSAGQLAGQRLVAGFSGGQVPGKLRRLIHRGRLAGVILFDENLGGRRHARGLIRRLQRIKRPSGLRRPLLVMIDQEGGLVKRLAGPPDASALKMGRRGKRYSRRQGTATARNLKSVGVNVDLAPVLDVGRHGSAIRAQRRSFGSTPGRVIETAIPFAAALERHGVAATGKHFPGLGAARKDTDVSVQRIHLRRSRLRRIDERPYHDLVARGGDMVMVSTAIYTHFSHRPAAFTHEIATDELRGRLGFHGVSISDALETVSARDYGGPAKVGLAAARAGTDLLLYTDFRAAAKAGAALQASLRTGRIARPGFERSVQRVLDLRARLASR